MSCNCRGDRFFTRPIEDRCTTDVKCSSNITDCWDHTQNCGCNTCRCTAKSVIPGCYSGDVGGATFKDGLCQFVNRKVLLRVGNQTLCVVIAEVCDCVLKAICPKSGKVLYFNLDRVVDVQDIYS